MLVYPVRRRGLRARALLMQFGRLVTPRPNGRLETGVGVGEIGEVTSVPPVVDSRLRKHVDKATLEWYLGTGSRQKYFYGWCDDGGLLRSYVIGVPRRRYGLEGMVVMDFGAFGEGGEEVLNEVVAEIADRPAACGLPAEVEVLLWPIPGGYRGRVSPISRRYDAKLYYRMPARIDGAERVCLPMEGDKILL